jgi:hypothetical protein
MRVSRKDKAIDTKGGVFVNALGYRLGISNERGSGS